MESNVAKYIEDFRVLVRAAARAGRFADPVAFDPDEFQEPLLKASRRGDFVPVDGALLRDWDRDYPRPSADCSKSRARASSSSTTSTSPCGTGTRLKKRTISPCS
jgi:hypothetical protein